MSKRLNAQTNTILPFELVSYSPKAANDETFFLSLEPLALRLLPQAGQTFYQGWLYASGGIATLQNVYRSPPKIDRLRHRDTSRMASVQTPV